MPYREPSKARDRYDSLAAEFASEYIARGGKPGDFNRLICKVYCHITGNSYHDKSANHAAVSDAAAEIYRRDIAPYEDAKAGENGDLPWPVGRLEV